MHVGLGPTVHVHVDVGQDHVQYMCDMKLLTFYFLIYAHFIKIVFPLLPILVVLSEQEDLKIRQIN